MKSATAVTATSIKRAFPLKPGKNIIFIFLFVLVCSIALIKTFATTPNALKGDINGDGTVSINDMSILLSNYGKTTSSSTNSNADINADGIINVLDMSILLSNYGKNSTALTTTTVKNISQFNGGINTNSGTITDISAPADPKITMRSVVTIGGATYARGIIDKNPDGSLLSIGEGKVLSVDVSVIFRDTGHYTSVTRFDNYDPYTSDGSLLGIARYSDNTLHAVANQYNAAGAGLDIMASGITVQQNVRYDLRLEAQLSSVNGNGYTKLYVNGNLVAQSTNANNYQNRSFTKLRTGVTAVAGSPATVDFGNLVLSY
jgi:hypothetical protein